MYFRTCWLVLYGVPFPPKYDVVFSIVLFAFILHSTFEHPTSHFLTCYFSDSTVSEIWLAIINIEHSSFLIRHGSFLIQHPTFRVQHSSFRIRLPSAGQQSINIVGSSNWPTSPRITCQERSSGVGMGDALYPQAVSKDGLGWKPGIELFEVGKHGRSKGEFTVVCILGDPGAPSRDDGIFMGESLQQER